MAEAAATTRPARRRSATTTAPAKAAPAKAAPAPKAAEVPAKTDVTRFTVELEHVGTTKSYEKFGLPASYSGTIVGNVYAPLGTERVAVLVVGAGDPGEAIPTE